MQDAVEIFLIAVAAFLKINPPRKCAFDKYFELINDKISPAKLPFQTQLKMLNKIRVNSKHHGIQPDKKECERLSVNVREFFEEASNSILKANFFTISAIDLLTDGETKHLLLEAKEMLKKKNFEQCSILCSKAIYLELLKDYDISGFREGAKPRGLLGYIPSKAPYYAQRKEYIEEYVRVPTDFIVLDHSALDQELLKLSVSNTSFWNVWRLIPKVFRNDDGDWIIKEDFNKLKESVLEEKIEYIFYTTVDIILSIHTTQQKMEYNFETTGFEIELTSDEVTIYEKADKTSTARGNTPKGIFKIGCWYKTIGLDGDGPYWKIYCQGDGANNYGYIHNDYVK